MGILNVTPDSFFAESRKQSDEEIHRRVQQMVDEGAQMIDIGAYSSRPGADDVSPEEEMRRLSHGLQIVNKLASQLPVSVDTFRADVARMAVEEYGADIINDISGGEMDAQMFRTVAQLNVPYILMHMQGTPQTMQDNPQYSDFLREVFLYMAQRINRLRDMGVKDIILDPGFGFGKSIETQYQLTNELEYISFGKYPILIGISRKSFIYKPLNKSPHEINDETQNLHLKMLKKGASYFL